MPAEGTPLKGCRVVVTRPEGRGGDLIQRLTALGAQVRHIPVIRTQPPEDAGPLLAAARMAWAGEFDWVVLTSPAGVEAFADALRAVQPQSGPGPAGGEGSAGEAGADRAGGEPLAVPARLCVVGPATRRAAQAAGLPVAAEPEDARTAAIPEAMERWGGLSGARVLLAVADRADDRLACELGRRGARVVRVTAYRTVADPQAAGEVAALIAEGGCDVLVLASPSAVRAVAEALASRSAAGARPAARAAAIGPTTAEAARRAGLEVEQAEAPTAEAVAAAVVRIRERLNRGSYP